MMLRPRNLLALDEPTNHLDIPAREVLEEALDDYEGTIIVVSHDRYFLDRVVTKIVHVHDGRAEEHVGNYTEWKDRERASARPPSRQPEAQKRRRRRRPTPKKPEPKKRAHRRAREARRRRSASSSKKQKRLQELEDKIAGAESEIAALNDKLAADHGGDWTQAARARRRQGARSKQRLKSWMTEWERLGRRAARVLI